MKKSTLATIIVALLIQTNLLFAQDTTSKKDYRYMHMLSEDEMHQKINYNFQQTEPPVGPVRAIAEWEPMSAVLVRYPFGIPVEFIKLLATADTVITLVSGSSQESTVRTRYQNAGVDMSRVKFIYAPTDSYWTRDYGPWFIINGQKKVSVLDFNYNRPRENDNKVPQYFDEYLGTPFYAMNVVHTGGNFMCDGYGTAASTTIVYTESSSALGISNATVDERMLNYMGIDNHIVVQDPNNTYIDHIDCWGKFLDVDKILIRKVPTSHAQYNAIEAMASYWANKTSKWGNKYQVYRAYNPNNEPYSNSLILNGRVFVPITGSSNDNNALQVYRDAMPGYQVIGVPNTTSNQWESTDALHCRTHEIADKNMISIIHYPLLNQQMDTSQYTIVAKIDALSGAAFNTDSMTVHYRYNNNIWLSTPLINSGGSTFKAFIPNPMQGTTVNYYISSADQNGKVARHPYIGKYDPHVFTTGNTQTPLENVLLSHNTITFNSSSTNAVTLTLTNQSAQNLSIVSTNYSNMQHCNVTAQSTNQTIPCSLAQGESLSFQIAPRYATKNTDQTKNYNTDTLIFTSIYRVYKVVIKTDNLFQNESITLSHSVIEMNSDTTIFLQVRNNGILPCTLTQSNGGDLNAARAFPNNEETTFPLTLNAGDSIYFKVYPLIPTKQYGKGVIIDTLVLTSTRSSYRVIIKTTDVFINPPENITLSHSEIIFDENDSTAVTLTVTNCREKTSIFTDWNISQLRYVKVTPIQSNVALPYALQGGTSVQFRVKPIVATKSGCTDNMNIDTLRLLTEKNTYKVVLKAHKNFLNNVPVEFNSSVTAYPNPFSSILTITTNMGADAHATVYSPSGIAVARLKPTSQGVFVWNATELPRGVYLVIIESQSKRQHIRAVKI